MTHTQYIELTLIKEVKFDKINQSFASTTETINYLTKNDKTKPNV